VVAIRITDDGPEPDPVGKYGLHPAAELFPDADEDQLILLENDLRARGQQEPVLLDIEGRIVDGRARIRALDRIGVAPVTRTLSVDYSPWLVNLSANVGKVAGWTVSQRAQLAGKVPHRPTGGVGGPRADVYTTPPRRADVAALLKIANGSIQRYHRVQAANPPPGFDQAIAAGRLTVSMALRVLGALPPRRVETFIRRVLNGADAEQVANAMRVPLTHHTPRAPADPTRSQADRDAHTLQRHWYVNLPALEALAVALRSLQMVTESADGLDPSITPEQAGEMLKTLSRDRTSVFTVMKLLRERTGIQE
jgi:hypothetical protein